MMLMMLVGLVCVCAALAGEAHSQQLAEPPASRTINFPYSPVAPWDNPHVAPLLDLLPFPKHLVFVAVAAVTWLAAHGSLLLVGAVILIGLCTFTPFCAISLASFEKLESLPAEYYRSLEDAARSLKIGFDKYGDKGT